MFQKIDSGARGSVLRSVVRGSLGMAAVAAAVSACDDPTQPGPQEQELITEVTITLTPVGGGTVIASTITDPDGAGVEPPDPPTAVLTLTPGVTYEGTIVFTDASNPEDPEDITAEVEAEGDAHRIFYTVSGLTGVSIPEASLDEDDGGAPLGLSFQVVVEGGASGVDGSVRVVLSHYDDEPKGDGSVPSGETDVDVTFDASVS